MQHIPIKISKELNVSKATVSRALNNCSGVDHLTKERIVEIASKYGYKRYLSADIGIVMPSVPRFFWADIPSQLTDELTSSGLTFTVSLFSRMDCVQDALNCIQAAIDANISVLVLSAPNTPEICDLLNKYSDKMLIILLGGYVDTLNTFYVGENSYNNGYFLGKTYFTKHPSCSSVAVVAPIFEYNNIACERIAGFISAAEEHKVDIVKTIRIPYNTSILPSLIARELNGNRSDIQCVFSSDGITHYVCQAICKLKMNSTIDCIGFDDSLKQYKKGDVLKLVSQQNVGEQIKTVVSLVERYINTCSYPDKKYNYVDNVLLEQI